MKAMILAAGLGTRLRPFSEHTPKPLFTLNQRPVLDITIEKLHQSGFKTVIVNTHHHHHQIERFIAQRNYPIPVHLRHEPDILGTGGAIQNVADLWRDDPLLVINGDVVCDVDLACVWDAHQRYACAVTMVMHDHTDFNSVEIDDENFILGFSKLSDTAATGRRLAFTGIHVLNPCVLDYLPLKGPAHIIDAYDKMLKVGERIKAHVVQDHYWQDIGTPDRYHAAVFHQMAPIAFEKAFGEPVRQAIHRHHLTGDGSDRQWYRLESGSQKLIMADHGIRTQPDIQQEVDAYVDIGRHLKNQEAAVPDIILADPFAGLVFLEDLGDRHLQQVVRNQTTEDNIALYKRVIDAWLHMSVNGLQNFDTDWTYQSASYDHETILEKECRYFTEAFLQGYLGRPVTYASLADEFELLADATLSTGVMGLMHRDLQSRNIMVDYNRVAFIDFQGARPGPLQYDLASLLIDPYVALSSELQSQLLAYCADTLERLYDINAEAFINGYGYCVLTRNLQILGAFSFLSQVKKKADFENYIPTAIQHLQRHLDEFNAIELPKLRQVVDDAVRQVT